MNRPLIDDRLSPVSAVFRLPTGLVPTLLGQLDILATALAIYLAVVVIVLLA
ncbi:hypothetical protein I4J48_30160, partial [Pseudonocardia sp. KRD-169]|nr:hypothetical protein [Pseudonocardia abyssalis]